MNVPSDVVDAVDKILPAEGRPYKVELTREQSGIAIAAVITFLGVAVLGPAVARALQKQRALEERITRRALEARYRAREVRRQAWATGERAQRKMREMRDSAFGR